MVDVTPPGGCRAAGEHAAAVAHLRGPAHVRREQPHRAAMLQRHPVGAQHDPGHLPVAGQPAGPRRGDRRAEAHAGRTPADRGVGQVLQADRDDHLRFVPAQRRQGACGQLVVAQLHQRVRLPLGAGAFVPGTAAGLHEGLQRGLQPLPAHRVQVEPAGDAAVGVLGEGEPAALGRIGLGAVLIEPVQVVVHRLRHIGTRSGHGHAGEQPVHHRQVHVLLRGRGERLGFGHPGDGTGLLPGHRTGGERGGHPRQVRQRAAGTHHPGGLRDRQVPVPPQPRAHGLQPVDLRGTGHLGLPHGAGDLGGQPVLRGQQRAQPVQQRRAEQRGEVLGGQGIECGEQLVHDTSHRIDQVFEV